MHARTTTTTTLIAALALSACSAALAKPPARPAPPPGSAARVPPARLEREDHLALRENSLSGQVARLQLEAAVRAQSDAQRDADRLERERAAIVAALLKKYAMSDGDRYDDDPNSPTFLSIRRAPSPQPHAPTAKPSSAGGK